MRVLWGVREEQKEFGLLVFFAPSTEKEGESKKGGWRGGEGGAVGGGEGKEDGGRARSKTEGGSRRRWFEVILVDLI